jgi:hypothetical protein
MTIAAYRDRESGAYPIAMSELRRRVPNVALPAVFDQEAYDLVGADAVEAVDQPLPQDSQAIREGNPVKKSGKWRQVWIVEDLAQPEPTVPEAVTMRQARLALLGAGVLDAAEAAIAGIPGVEGRVAQIEWEYATELRRDHPLVAGLGQGLGLDDGAIDVLFMQAAQII